MKTLVSKAYHACSPSLYGVRNAGIEKTDVEYVIDCAEEACGDMNQRGSVVTLRKRAAEVAGLLNATRF